ncbi:MAG: prepilin-type N-terminal cleavage/methylation domain-containing protein [Bacilli bacterium]|nr:prepilin-type N-terminal cleavage/methylation domain-containing protein [Bacilli bacterium]
MKNKGYTIPELIAVIAILGIISIITIVKTSYAFSNDTEKEVQDNNYFLIEKQAEVYGELNKDKFEEKNEIYILVQDLVDAKLLPVDENNNILSSEKDLSKTKIKITLKEDKITAEIVK